MTLTTALAACSGSPAPGDAVSQGGTPVALPSSPEALPLVDVAGYNQLLGQLHGTPVVVNVWASWCGPCKDEAPLLRQGALNNPNVQFLGVDIQDSKAGAIGFIRRYAIPYPSVFDPPAALRTHLGFIGQPDTLFYGANGGLVSQVIGPLTQSTLDLNLAKITA